MLLTGARSRIACLAQALFGNVPDEISDVEGRIAEAIQIEVDHVDSLAVHHYLRRVEIAMNSASIRFGDTCSQAVARRRHLIEAPTPLRVERGDFR